MDVEKPHICPAEPHICPAEPHGCPVQPTICHAEPHICHVEPQYVPSSANMSCRAKSRHLIQIFSCRAAHLSCRAQTCHVERSRDISISKCHVARCAAAHVETSPQILSCRAAHLSCRSKSRHLHPILRRVHKRAFIFPHRVRRRTSSAWTPLRANASRLS